MDMVTFSNAKKTNQNKKHPSAPKFFQPKNLRLVSWFFFPKQKDDNRGNSMRKTKGVIKLFMKIHHK